MMAVLSDYSRGLSAWYASPFLGLPLLAPSAQLLRSVLGSAGLPTFRYWSMRR
jgi:hypothetical protein